jgi:hypothetical protein
MSPYDPGLWISTTRKHLYITVYVDDFKIVAECLEDANWLLNTLKEHFEITDLGRVERYLGMDVEFKDNGTIRLSQRPYIEDVLESFGMEDANPASTPFEAGSIIDDKHDPSNSEFTIKEYQRGVGCIQYLATKTRPELSRVASFLAQYNAAPTPKCWKAFKHALRYLRSSIDKGIEFYRKGDNEEHGAMPSLSPIGYSDSDWAGPHNEARKSTSGFIFSLSGGPISWKSTKQTCTALSTNEAEYVAASEAAREAAWIRNILTDSAIGDQQPITIYMDNKGAIDLTKVEAVTKRSKHIDVRFHYTRELITHGSIRIEHVPTTAMAADGLTKPLNAIKFKAFRDLIGVK